jgi:serine/threonine protein kinase
MAMDASDLVLRITEEFAEKIRRGEQPTVDEFVELYPAHAKQLRQLLTTIEAMEKLAGFTSEKTVPANAVGHQDQLQPHTLFGDFELLEEIGRGGMGVVYRAKQTSLDRIVAIKLLGERVADKHTYSQRFQREARAAAGLHHTNIVPVFGAGIEQGTPYYIMQFIDGISLDQFLREVKTLRDFEQVDAQTLSATDSTSPINRKCSRRQKVLQLLDLWNLDVAKVLLQKQYYRVVAQIGYDVAMALDYANSLGIVHRDIKPANLIIDEHGKTWITDFGLAKSIHHETITAQNDLLGTLRYMAPERFSGICDLRSDIFSLGLTLYEMMTLKPVYSEPDRSKLIRDVSLGHRRQVRRENHLVPESLATIIDKSQAVNPLDRYQTGSDFGDDLRRFLNDEPIRAKPETRRQRTIRWCRKNPIISVLALLLCAALVVLTFSQVRIVQEKNRYQQSLAESLLAQGRFQRLTGTTGQRVASLQNIARAAAISQLPGLAPEAIQGMTLPDIEFLHRQSITNPSNSIDSLSFSPDLQKYITYGDGFLELRTFPDWLVNTNQPTHKEDNSLASPEPTANLLSRFEILQGSITFSAKFSTSGDHILACFNGQSGDRILRIFDWRKAKTVRSIERVAERAFSLWDQKHLLSVGVEEGGLWYVRTWNNTSHKLVSSVQLPCMPFSFEHSQRDARIAITLPESGKIWIVDVLSSSVEEIDCGEDIYAVAWHPDLDQVAIGLGYDIDIRNLETPSLSLRRLKGHKWVIHGIRYHPGGHLLSSHSLREGLTRVWDLRRDKQVLLVDGHLLGFSPDGTRTIVAQRDKLAFGRLWNDEEYRVISNSNGSSQHVWRTTKLRDAPIVLSIGGSGLTAWSVLNGKFLGESDRFDAFTMVVDEGSNRIVMAGNDGVREVSYTINTEDSTIDFSPTKQLTLAELPAEQFQEPAFGIQGTLDRAVFAVSMQHSPDLFLFDQTRSLLGSLRGEGAFVFFDLSPGGKLISSVHEYQSDYVIYDTTKLATAVTLETASNAGQSFFAPNEKWLVTCSHDRYTIYEVGSWRTLCEVMSERVIEGAAAFSCESNLLALVTGNGTVQLLSTTDWQEVATLKTETEEINVLNLEFSPDDRLLLLSCGPQGIRIWDLPRVVQSMRELGIQSPLREYYR